MYHSRSYSTETFNPRVPQYTTSNEPSRAKRVGQPVLHWGSCDAFVGMELLMAKPLNNAGELGMGGYMAPDRQSLTVVRGVIYGVRAPLSQMAMLTRGKSNDRPSISGLEFFRTTSIPLTILTSTTSFDDGLNFPATERARWCYFNIRYLHPNSKPCQGHLRCSTSSGCLRFRCRAPHDDSGASPPTSWTRASDPCRLGFDGQ